MTPARAARDRSLSRAAALVARHLVDGEEVAWITLGDPLTYSTFSAVADRVRQRRPATVVDPGARDHGLSGPGRPDRDGHRRRADATDHPHRPRRRRPDRRPGRPGHHGGASTRAAAACRSWRTRWPPAGAVDAAVAGELLGMPGERVGRLEQLAAGGPASYLATVIVPAAHGDGPVAPSTVGPDRDLLRGRRAGRRRPDHPARRPAPGRRRRGDLGVVARARGRAQHCRPGANVHDSATMTLEDVLGVYRAHPEGTRIVRLHSGDPSIYGAIGEQIDWCRSPGRSWEIVPGVSSLAAAAAALGQELTQPGVAQSVVLTRLGGRTRASMPASESVAAFAAHGPTMAVFLSAARPDELAAELLAPGSGYRPETPAAIVIRATWPDERVIRTTVGDLAARPAGHRRHHDGAGAGRRRPGRGSGRPPVPPLLPGPQHGLPASVPARLHRGPALGPAP